jgi:hypothetical protein
MLKLFSIVLAWLLVGGCWGAKQRDKDTQTGMGPGENAILSRAEPVPAALTASWASGAARAGGGGSRL